MDCKQLDPVFAGDPIRCLGLFEKPHVPHVSLRLVSKAMPGRVKPSDVRTCRDMSSNCLLPLRSVSLAGDQCKKTSK